MDNWSGYGNGYGYGPGVFPLGAAALTGFLDEAPFAGDRPLTEAEKEEMIFRYRDTDKEDEKERIRSALSEESEITSILDGPGIG